MAAQPSPARCAGSDQPTDSRKSQVGRGGEGNVDSQQSRQRAGNPQTFSPGLLSGPLSPASSCPWHLEVPRGLRVLAPSELNCGASRCFGSSSRRVALSRCSLVTRGPARIALGVTRDPNPRLFPNASAANQCVACSLSAGRAAACFRSEQSHDAWQK